MRGFAGWRVTPVRTSFESEAGSDGEGGGRARARRRGHVSESRARLLMKHRSGARRGRWLGSAASARELVHPRVTEYLPRRKVVMERAGDPQIRGDRLAAARHGIDVVEL